MDLDVKNMSEDSSPSQDAKELERKQLQDRVDQLEAEREDVRKTLSEATKLANVGKDALVEQLQQESRGYFNKDDLEKLSDDSLQILQRSFSLKVNRDYQDILDKRQAQDETYKRKLGATGSYNQETGKWEGGLPQNEEE